MRREEGWPRTWQLVMDKGCQCVGKVVPTQAPPVTALSSLMQETGTLFSEEDEPGRLESWIEWGSQTKQEAGYSTHTEDQGCPAHAVQLEDYSQACILTGILKQPSTFCRN